MPGEPLSDIPVSNQPLGSDNQREEPDETKAEVVSRVRIAPTLVGKVIQALNTNMSNYEDRFGPISVRD
jgi:hypothetical protein